MPKSSYKSMWTVNFQMFKLDLEKEEEPEIKLSTSNGSSKKQESSRKISTSLLTMPKHLTVCITNWKILQRWEYQTTLPASWEICMKVKKQQLEPSWNNGLVPNWERSMSRLYIVTLVIWILCRVHYVKCWAGWNNPWNHDCWKKYQ